LGEAGYQRPVQDQARGGYGHGETREALAAPLSPSRAEPPIASHFRRTRLAYAGARDLIVGIWRSPFWWLAPLVVVLLPLAVVFALVQAVPFVAPFVYAMF
jgi:hypothetical protein